MHDEQGVDLTKVRPIQMGEFVRKYGSRWLSALSAREIKAMRQVGVGSQGGTEAPAIFHQLIFYECATGSLNAPSTRIIVDKTNCFGMIEWQTARPNSRQWPGGNTALSFFLCKKESRQCQKIEVQSREMFMVL